MNVFKCVVIEHVKTYASLHIANQARARRHGKTGQAQFYVEDLLMLLLKMSEI